MNDNNLKLLFIKQKIIFQNKNISLKKKFYKIQSE